MECTAKACMLGFLQPPHERTDSEVLQCRSGIDLILNSRVCAVDSGSLTIEGPDKQRKRLEFGACLWATGGFLCLRKACTGLQLSSSWACMPSQGCSDRSQSR